LLRKIPEFKKGIPGKKRVLKEINRLTEESIKVNVELIINSNLPYSVALDIATTKGMKSSYLGIILTYSADNLEVKNFALDVIELRERHTGQNLKKEVCDSLQKWNLKLEDASAIVTDGASNMSKAFK